MKTIVTFIICGILVLTGCDKHMADPVSVKITGYKIRANGFVSVFSEIKNQKKFMWTHNGSYVPEGTPDSAYFFSSESICKVVLEASNDDYSAKDTITIDLSAEKQTIRVTISVTFVDSTKGAWNLMPMTLYSSSNVLLDNGLDVFDFFLDKSLAGKEYSLSFMPLVGKIVDNKTEYYPFSKKEFWIKPVIGVNKYTMTISLGRQETITLK